MYTQGSNLEVLPREQAAENVREAKFKMAVSGLF